jgi:hypothetical protein
MLETQLFSAIYASVLLYLAGNLAGPGWMRRSGTPPLPAALRSGVWIATAIGLAALAWAGLADTLPAIGWRECAAWMAVLVETLVFLKIAMHRDHWPCGRMGGLQTGNGTIVAPAASQSTQGGTHGAR